MNNFVWPDLSTYNPETSKRFYERVFGWSFHDTGGYHVALQGSSEIAGLFETPGFFKQIKMPHFWMSYIAVEDVLPIADLAGSFKEAKVELTDDFYGGKVALIRDPQGAGFTIYDGGRLDSRKPETGHMVWNELHVSDASQVIPFYERVFGWTIDESASQDKYAVFNYKQEHISDILVIPNSVKGKYEYWVCTFAVDDLNLARQRIEENGGGVVIDEGERLMMHDNSGEAFFYIQCIE
ncbi:MAG: VOC family protein [Planctomycetota bacterium]